MVLVDVVFLITRIMSLFARTPVLPRERFRSPFGCLAIQTDLPDAEAESLMQIISTKANFLIEFRSFLFPQFEEGILRFLGFFFCSRYAGVRIGCK